MLKSRPMYKYNPLDNIFILYVHPPTHTASHILPKFSHYFLYPFIDLSVHHCSQSWTRQRVTSSWINYSSDCRRNLKRNIAIQWTDTSVINFNSSKIFSFHLPERPVPVIPLHIIEEIMARIEGALINVCFASRYQQATHQNNEDIQTVINSIIFW